MTVRLMSLTRHKAMNADSPRRTHRRHQVQPHQKSTPVSAEELVRRQAADR